MSDVLKAASRVGFLISAEKDIQKLAYALINSDAAQNETELQMTITITKQPIGSDSKWKTTVALE